MAAMFPRIRKFVKQMVISIIVFHGSYVIIRLTSSEKRELTANSFYLFDVSRSPVYELILLSQLTGFVFYGVMFFDLWGLYATFICIACSQLEKLRAKLLDIRQKDDVAEEDSGAETDQEEEEEEQGLVQTSQRVFLHMQKQLNDCIRHHQQIIRFMNAMEDTLNPVLLGLFFIAMTSICLSAFSIVMNLGDAMPIIQSAVICGAMMFLLFAFCRLGEELTHHATSIGDAVWNSNWVGTPVSFQGCLILITATANKKFCLTAGKFVSVSNNTMVNIFNQTMSFFMFLLKMKDRPNLDQHQESTAT
ncbi:odorant receptor 4-like [Zootermopsis nevadensis]|nr:odorant receptor 4-like [Zootermopsis nevadensis]